MAGVDQRAARASKALLVEAAREGSPPAVAALVEEYLPLVHGLVRRRLGDVPEVEDVVQKAMLRVVRGLPELQDPDAFRPWLISIVVRQARDHAQAAARRQSGRVDWAELPEMPDAGQEFAELTATEIELSHQRSEAVLAATWLSDPERELLALWWQETAGAVTRPEVAVALGTPLAHTAVRVQRLKAQLDVARIVVRGLSPRHGCPKLRTVLAPARKGEDRAVLTRLGRHVRTCEQCQAIGAQLLPLEGLLAGYLVPLPAVLLERTIEEVTREVARAGVSAAAGSGALKPLAVLGTAAAAVALAGVAAVHYLPAHPQLPQPTARTTAAVRAPQRPGSTTAQVIPQPSPALFGVTRADYYVAPAGDDAASGSLSRPFASLSKAVSVVSPGQTIAVRGGRYHVTAPVRISRSATATARITLSNFRGERPVFDLSDLGGPAGFIEQRADGWTVQGLELAGGRRSPYVCNSCSDNVFRHLSIHDSKGMGFVLRGVGSNRNRISDSDFSGNHDDAENGADADGLLIAYGSGASNVVAGCRFFNNADDGLDIVQFDGSVTVDSNWSYGNGVNRWNLSDYAGSGNGFRLGGGPSTAHLVINNAAWRNAGDGFDEGVNKGRVVLRSNTSFGNTERGFSFGSVAAEAERNLTAGNGQGDETGPAFQQGRNLWQASIPAAGLLITDEAAAEGPRNRSGLLPATSFLTGADGGGSSMRLAPG